MNKNSEEAPLYEIIYKPTIYNSASEASSEALKPDSNSTKLFPYIAAAVACLVMFITGITLGWTSPVLPKLKSTDPEDNPLGRRITPVEESWITGCWCLGALFGPLIAGTVADKMGRKKLLLIIACPMAVSMVAIAFSRTVVLYYILRFMLGVGSGSTFTVLPMYLGEIAEDHNRGTLGCFVCVFLTSGLLFAYAVGPYVTIKNFCLLSAVPSLIFFAVFTIWIPESPQFLAIINDRDGLEASLLKFRKKTAAEVRKEAEEMLKTAEVERKNKRGFRDLVGSTGLRKALLICVVLMILQQFAGINAVLCYMQTIFDAAGGGLSPEIATIIIGIVQVVTTIVTSSIVDRLGRRVLLLLSLVGSCLSLISLGAYFYLQTHEFNVDSIFWLPVLSLLVYIISFSIGVGPLPWAIMSELFPSNVKSAAMALSSFVCFFGAFVVTLCFPLLASVLGMTISLWFFAVCCVIGIVFVYCILPETKGKSLQEIQQLLKK